MFMIKYLTTGDDRKWQNHLVVPLENFAGQDLLKIHSDNQEKGSEERKTLQAKIEAARATQSGAATPLVKEAAAADKSSDKPALGGEEAAEPVHEGITCDACKVNCFLFVQVLF